jgi:hypothetical protein
MHEHVKLQIHLNQNRRYWKIETFAVRIVLEMIFKLVIFSINDSLQIRFYVMFFTCVFFYFFDIKTKIITSTFQEKIPCS